MMRLSALAAACPVAATSATAAQDQCPDDEHIIAMAFERGGTTLGYLAIDTQSDTAFRCNDAQNRWDANYTETGNGGFTFSFKARNGTWPRTMKRSANGVVEDTWYSGGRAFRMVVVDN